MLKGDQTEFRTPIHKHAHDAIMRAREMISKKVLPFLSRKGIIHVPAEATKKIVVYAAALGIPEGVQDYAVDQLVHQDNLSPDCWNILLALQDSYYVDFLINGERYVNHNSVLMNSSINVYIYPESESF